MALRAIKGYLVGYEGMRGHIFKIQVPKQNIVIRAYNVRFFNKSNNNNEGIQHVVSFEEVCTKNIEEEEEIMP